MWIEQPRKLPFICPLDGVGDRENGPYFETPLVYNPVLADGYDLRPMTLAISVGYIRSIAMEPGSPGVWLPRDEHQAMIAEQHRLTELVAEQSDEITALKAELAEARSAADAVEPLADAIAARISAQAPRQPRRRAAA